MSKENVNGSNVGIKDIKFSEETKEFATGAHRGGGEKYPTEYLPFVEAMEVLKASKTLSKYSREEACDKISQNIENFKKTGDPALIAEAGAIFAQINYKSMFECLGKTALHFKQGADKYGMNNWQLGMPLLDYIGSLSRHFIKFVEGWDDEPHDTAFMWNVLTIMWTTVNLPTMNNLHIKKNTKNNV